MANPTLNSGTFSNLSGTSDSPMTLAGTQAKIAILGLLCIGTGAFAWNAGAPLISVLIACVVGLILALIISFKPATAPMLAPLYAIAEGWSLGVISHLYEWAYHGIVGQAALATAAVFCATLGLYVMRIVRPTQRFMAVVSAATLGVFLSYMAGFVMRLFGIVLFEFSSPISIGLSVLVCVIAAANLIIDYGVIEAGVQSGAPKYMEWYSAFGLLVTVVWLYLEILRLLAKLQKRD